MIVYDKVLAIWQIEKAKDKSSGFNKFKGLSFIQRLCLLYFF